MAIISKVFKPSDFESRDSLQGIFTNTDLVFNPLGLTPQNGQTHSNSSLALADILLECV